ncbi:ABC transporter ATP-binding protein [Desulfogranum japonicum]|uniref:ABC transporter ATP-binding protein n=1 Tax=Desulfogranum japonicum TaxID=231447 RepID=UPI00068462E9|nr:dipeptide/oligopeptide/nickel ABC transporter ATP-binding protein [Desulfogranum japonicum]
MSNTSEPLVSVQRVNKFFNKLGKSVHILKDVTLDIHPGECVGMVGSSGSGKSTLARILCRIHCQEKGTILFRGRNIFRINRQDYYRQVQMVFQDPLACFPQRMTVKQFLLEPYRNFKLLNGCGHSDLAAKLLERVNLSVQYLGRYPNQLSGGQLQRIVFSRVTGLNPQLVICDEATSALDVTIQAQIIALFQKLQKQQKFASLFITHDLALAEKLCDTIHVMDDGAIVETLTSGNIVEEAQHPATQRMIRASCGLAQAAGLTAKHGKYPVPGSL